MKKLLVFALFTTGILGVTVSFAQNHGGKKGVRQENKMETRNNKGGAKNATQRSETKKKSKGKGIFDEPMDRTKK